MLLNATGWHHSNGVQVPLFGQVIGAVEADAELKGCTAYRVVLACGVAETYRKIGGEWVCTCCTGDLS